MVAAPVNPPRLVSRLTQYDHRRMCDLYALILQMRLNDALYDKALGLEYVKLDNGYPFYALTVNDALYGIVDVRGSDQWRKVQRALTAYLWRFGFSANEAVFVGGGALIPTQPATWRYFKGEWLDYQMFRFNGKLQYIPTTYLSGGWELGNWKHRDLPKLFDLE